MFSFKEAWGNLRKHITAIAENIYYTSSLVFFASLFIGIAFYMHVNQWSFALSYYFAASVLLGDMYLLPTEPTSASQLFTLCYFLWGTTLLAGAVAATANTLITNAGKVAADERKRIMQLQSTVSNRVGNKKKSAESSSSTGLDESAKYYKNLSDTHPHMIYLQMRFYEFLRSIHWFHYRSKYIAISSLLFWVFVGFLYGEYYEGWDYSYSLKFAFAAVSASGSFPPTCPPTAAGSCDLGTVRSLLVGSYIIVGVPIFAYTMGQFAEFLVEHAIRVNEQNLMLRPLTEEEFRFAYELQKGTVLADVYANEEEEEEDYDEDDEEEYEGGSYYDEDEAGGDGSSYDFYADPDAGDATPSEVTDSQPVSRYVSRANSTTNLLPADGDMPPASSLSRQPSGSLRQPQRRRSLSAQPSLGSLPPPLPLQRSASRLSTSNRSEGQPSQRRRRPQRGPRPRRDTSGSHRHRRSRRRRGAAAGPEVTDFQLDLGYFIILELLRIQKITQDDLLSIKALFDRLDEDKDGKLTKCVSAKRKAPRQQQPLSGQPPSLRSRASSVTALSTKAATPTAASSRETVDQEERAESAGAGGAIASFLNPLEPIPEELERTLSSATLNRPSSLPTRGEGEGGGDGDESQLTRRVQLVYDPSPLRETSHDWRHLSLEIPDRSSDGVPLSRIMSTPSHLVSRRPSLIFQTDRYLQHQLQLAELAEEEQEEEWRRERDREEREAADFQDQTVSLHQPVADFEGFGMEREENEQQLGKGGDNGARLSPSEGPPRRSTEQWSKEEVDGDRLDSEGGQYQEDEEEEEEDPHTSLTNQYNDRIVRMMRGYVDRFRNKQQQRPRTNPSSLEADHEPHQREEDEDEDEELVHSSYQNRPPHLAHHHLPSPEEVSPPLFEAEQKEDEGNEHRSFLHRLFRSVSRSEKKSPPPPTPLSRAPSTGMHEPDRSPEDISPQDQEVRQMEEGRKEAPVERLEEGGEEELGPSPRSHADPADSPWLFSSVPSRKHRASSMYNISSQQSSRSRHGPHSQPHYYHHQHVHPHPYRSSSAEHLVLPRRSMLDPSRPAGHQHTPLHRHLHAHHHHHQAGSHSARRTPVHHTDISAEEEAGPELEPASELMGGRTRRSTVIGNENYSTFAEAPARSVLTHLPAFQTAANQREAESSSRDHSRRKTTPPPSDEGVAPESDERTPLLQSKK